MSLGFAPFLPSDNLERKSVWVMKANYKIGELLRMPSEKFVSHIHEDTGWRIFLDSYFAHRTRWYDDGVEDMDDALRSLDRRVLMALSRWANAGFSLDASQLVAVCAMHSQDNAKIIRRLAKNCHDLKRAGLETARALSMSQDHLPEDDAVRFGLDAAASIGGLAVAQAMGFFVETEVLPKLAAFVAVADENGLIEALQEAALAVAAHLPEAAVEWFCRGAPRFKDNAAVESALVRNYAPTDAESRALLNVAVQALRIHDDDDSEAAKLTRETSKSATPKDQIAEPAADELSRRVSAVKAVVGDNTYGEGYIALCLAVLNYDVDAVASRLLDGKPPPQLSHIDPGLDRIQKQTRDDLDIGAADFVKAQKARLRTIEAAQEEAVRLYDAYDDDYDDRYDDPPDPEVTATPLDSWDQDLVRKYNALKRAEEDEDEFWEHTRNTNRDLPAHDDQDSNETQIQHSNIRPPHTKSRMETAAVGHVSTSGGADKRKTAIQRKRAQKNKAAIANHHRKDRATRKTAAAFPAAR